MSDGSAPPTSFGDWVLAFDCGTSSLKAAVLNPDGEILAEASAGYKVHYAEGGLAEQDADEIWASVVEAGRAALGRAAESGNARCRDIGAVVFVATWKALLPLDGAGRPLRRAAIWMDSRARDQAKRLNEAMGRFIGTGQEYWPRVMQLKEDEPELWAAAHRIVGVNTYLKFKATDVLANEPSDDFIHGVDEDSRNEFAEILQAAGLTEDREKFLQPLPPDALVGGLTLDAAEELGLQPDTPVFNGYADLPAIMMGTGTGSPGQAHIYLGSSSWFMVATETKPQDAPLTVSILERLHSAAYVVQSGGLAYDWAVAQLYHAERDQLGGAVNELVNREVAEVAPGSDNLLATHWINGELPPLSKNARGLFINLTPLHDRRHMVRAMMESVCYAHRAGYEAYLANGGVSLGAVRVVGGGATSDVWMQMLADVLAIPVEVPANPRSTGTLGAFYAAQVGLGNLASFDEIGDTVVIDRRFAPDASNGRVYTRLYEVHSQLYHALRGIFIALNGEY